MVSEPVQVTVDGELVNIIVNPGDECRVTFVGERDSVRVGR